MRLEREDTTSTTVPADRLVPELSWADLLRDLVALGKPRLTAMVLMTTAVGYVLASVAGVDWLVLAWTILGTGLAAHGANTLNEWWEAGRDARMRRTRRRPLPQQRLGDSVACVFGLATGLGGPLVLAGMVNAASAGLALATYLIYVLAYTPLKPYATANTLVGAIVGALPPMIGWVAATGALALEAWILGGILLVWQVPHFLALAWLCRDDYALGGMRMLPVIDRRGYLTGCVVVVYTLLLLPLTVALTLVGATGWVYASGAVVLGLCLLAVGVQLERRRTAAAARRLFLATLVYLPLLLGLMLIDRQPTPSSGGAVAPVVPEVSGDRS